MEEGAALTVLIYGHGDTVRGLDESWRAGLSPWVLTVEGKRIYGRGTADNKGQHSINIAALAAVVAERGSLDRKSTRLNSSHLGISYAVFCLKKKKKNKTTKQIIIT